MNLAKMKVKISKLPDLTDKIIIKEMNPEKILDRIEIQIEFRQEINSRLEVPDFKEGNWEVLYKKRKIVIVK